MRRRSHLVIGTMAFVLYQLALEAVGPAVQYPWFIGVFAAALGSVFPDTLEPGTSIHHRGICHSRGALKLAAVLFLVAAAISVVPLPVPHPVLVYLASCFFLGYAFHLLADSCTRMGLPG